jgi:hypothetical protein
LNISDEGGATYPSGLATVGFHVEVAGSKISPPTGDSVVDPAAMKIRPSASCVGCTTRRTRVIAGPLLHVAVASS